MLILRIGTETEQKANPPLRSQRISILGQSGQRAPTQEAACVKPKPIPTIASGMSDHPLQLLTIQYLWVLVEMISKDC